MLIAGFAIAGSCLIVYGAITDLPAVQARITAARERLDELLDKRTSTPSDELESQILFKRDEIKQAQSELAAERQEVVRALFVGHLLMLGILAGLYVARQTERRLRKASDRQLLAADERFAMVVRGSTDGIIVTDDSGRIEITNPAVACMLGVREDTLPGQSITEYFKTTLINEWLANRLDDGAEDDELSRRVRAIRSDGEIFLAELTITPRRIEGREFLAISVRDVSEREASRLRLKQHEALLTEIPEPLHILDAVGRIVYWNRGAEQIYGYDANEAIGQTANDLLRIIPPKMELDSVHANDYLDAERWSGELLATTKNGKTLRIERRRTRIDEGDDSIGEVVLDLDLGERTRLQQVERRRQRLESLGTLSSGIAHDLNNLLTPILMSSKMLQRDSSNVDRNALIETISSGASRGAELIDQLLTFARGGDGQHQLINLQAFFPDLVAIVERAIPKTMRLEVQLEADLPDVFGDETEISQVLMNLAVNARDAMGDSGTLVIRVSRIALMKEKSYTTTTLQPGDYIAIAVSDTGTGIPPNIRDRIFDPFFSTKQRGQGTGLGLSTTIGIVKSHHGGLGIASAVGKGTTVTVVLPVHEDVD
jgi:PAS domain S-box-containing protein